MMRALLLAASLVDPAWLGSDRLAQAARAPGFAALARKVAGRLGGSVGVAPRLFLKKLVGDVLDRVEAAGSWWGSMIGTAHGEPFSSREPVALRGFADLF